jgi:hypothetical protein
MADDEYKALLADIAERGILAHAHGVSIAGDPIFQQAVYVLAEHGRESYEGSGSEREQAFAKATRDPYASRRVGQPSSTARSAGKNWAKVPANRGPRAPNQPRRAGVLEAPRVGLEPTTLRLTAGCSAN